MQKINYDYLSLDIVISISRNRLSRFIIERSDITKKQYAFKSVHFECRIVLFWRYGGKVDFNRNFSVECRKILCQLYFTQITLQIINTNLILRGINSPNNEHTVALCLPHVDTRRKLCMAQIYFIAKLF